MARLDAPRTPDAPAPLLPSKDTGLPWKIIAAGSGRKGLSSVHQALESTGKVTFYGVDDARAGAVGLGRLSSSDTAKNRNRLAAELKKGRGVDLDRVLKYVTTLVAHNKKHGGGTPPTALHLYMGVGEVKNLDRSAAAGLLRQLCAAAEDMRGYVTDPECDQMLHWIGEAWKDHAKLLDVAVPSATGPATTATLAGPTTDRARDQVSTAQAPGELHDPKVILQRARLRDQLLTALRTHDEDAIGFALLQVPDDVVKLKKFFPPPCLGVSYAGMELAAERYIDAFDSKCDLVGFARFCERQAAASNELNTTLTEHPEIALQYDPRVREICVLMARTNEADLHEHSETLKTMMARVLKSNGSSLHEDLAGQPFASDHALLQKCLVLEKWEPGPTVKEFREVVKWARTARLHASEELRAELLQDPVGERRVRHLSRAMYARFITSSPDDGLVQGAPVAQIRSMRQQVNALIESWGNRSKRALDVFVLKWVDRQLASALQNAGHQ